MSCKGINKQEGQTLDNAAMGSDNKGRRGEEKRMERRRGDRVGSEEKKHEVRRNAEMKEYGKEREEERNKREDKGGGKER